MPMSGRHQLFVGDGAAIGQQQQVLGRNDAGHARPEFHLAAQLGNESVHERLETTAQWIAEARVRPLGFGHRAQCPVDHFLEVRHRHPAAEP
jgi:hypothetical protein